MSNRTSRVVGSTTDTYATFGTSNRINTITTGSNVRSFIYLPTGQVSGDTRDPSDAYVYNYNQTGRLASATLNGGTVGTYLVNGLEQRVVKTVGSTTTHYIFDRFGHLLSEANGSTGAIQKEYIWLDDLLVAEIDDTGSSPVMYYVHADHLGRPQKMTDATATIVWDGVFDPFGNVTSVTGSTTNLIMFPGQYYDSETQLSQNWNRDYDPTIGKYVQSDPIGISGGINTYNYVFGNPIRLHDPKGKEAIGALIGGLEGAWYGGIGALASGGDLGDVLSGAAAGGLLGAGIGFLDPTFGVGTTLLLNGLESATSDLAAQEADNLWHDRPLSCINYGSLIGAGIGGAVGGWGAGAITGSAPAAIPGWLANAAATSITGAGATLIGMTGAALGDNDDDKDCECNNGR